RRRGHRWYRRSRTPPSPRRYSRRRDNGRADRKSGRRASAASRKLVIGGPKLVEAEPPIRSGIAVEPAFIVGEQEIVAVAADDIVGEERDLAAATGSIDDIGGH